MPLSLLGVIFRDFSAPQNTPERAAATLLRMKLHHLARTALVSGLAALLTLMASQSHAQDGTNLTTYDVELVIFRYLNPTGTPEQWSTAAPARVAATSENGELPPVDAGTPAEFPATPPTQFKLTAVKDRLQRSRDYRVLAHIGWRQPGFSRENARPLNLDGLLPAGSQLTGQAFLSRSKFLNLTLNLRLTPSDLPADSPVRIVLSETRRMRSNEKHYIDHPYFGVVAIITPVGAGG
jgi:hypothetical protein